MGLVGEDVVGDRILQRGGLDELREPAQRVDVVVGGLGLTAAGGEEITELFDPRLEVDHHFLLVACRTPRPEESLRLTGARCRSPLPFVTTRPGPATLGRLPYGATRSKLALGPDATHTHLPRSGWV